jgi:hypothetical protein
VLPAADTWDALPAEAVLRPGVVRLCGALGVDPAGLVRFAAGSRPVYAAGDLVLKLYPPLDAGAHRVEAGVLAAVSGALPVATPVVHAVGEEAGGWGYVLMSRLPGVPLDRAWPELGESDRDRQLSGVIDFEPAMRGVREYEFVALGLFTAGGDPRFLRQTLTAYGYAHGDLDAGFRRRLTGWTILHRYSHLAAYLDRLPPPEPTFEAAADRWFAT